MTSKELTKCVLDDLDHLEPEDLRAVVNAAYRRLGTVAPATKIAESMLATTDPRVAYKAAPRTDHMVADWQRRAAAKANAFPWVEWLLIASFFAVIGYLIYSGGN